MDQLEGLRQDQPRDQLEGPRLDQRQGQPRDQLEGRRQDQPLDPLMDLRQNRVWFQAMPLAILRQRDLQADQPLDLQVNPHLD